MRICNLLPFAVPALVLAAGCSRPVGGLAGKVTLNGEPLPVGQVMAFNEANELVGATAVVAGEYELANLPPGPVTLTVQTHQPSGQPLGPGALPPPPQGVRPPPPDVLKDMQKDLPDAARKGLESVKPVPLKYTTIKQSDLKATVSTGRTTFDIAMTGKGEIPRLPPGPTAGGPPPRP